MLKDVTADAIKEAIARLPDEDRHALAAWLNGLEYDEWDKQMAIDFSLEGRVRALIERVKHEIAEGQAIPFKAGRAKAVRRHEPGR
jgi:hypothetical protein